MINKLTIQNFQSHKKTELKFDPSVNIIIGSSDSGKTAIIRALRWLVWNRPSGESFRSNWGGDTSVELDLGGIKIERIKGKQGVYKLGDELFKAFGTHIPVEIVKALNLNEINLQQQLDSPFLLTSSPGDVAKHFNKIANLDQIDKGLTNIQKEIRDISNTIKFKTDLVDGYNIDLKEYEHLEKFEIEVEVLEQIEHSLAKTIRGEKSLSGFLGVIEKNSIEIEEASEILKFEEPVNKILDQYTEITKKKDTKGDLRLLIHNINTIKDKIKTHENLLQREPLVISLLEKYEERKEKLITKLQLVSLIDDIDNVQMKQERLAERLEKYKNEFDEAMPDICPLCEQKIK